MCSDMVEAACRYSDFLRLCWMGALLHDFGKLGIHFILSKEPGSPVVDIHGQIIFSDGDLVPPGLFDILSTPFEKLCPVPPGFEGFSLLYFMCSHHGCTRCLGGQVCGDPLMSKHRLAAMLQNADRVDVSNPPDKNKQYLLDIRGSDFFCQESELHPQHFARLRKMIYTCMEKILNSGKVPPVQKNIRLEGILERNLSKGLSETRKWGHDIDIFSHAHSVAVYLRLMLLEQIRRAPESEETPFRILRVFCSTRTERVNAIEFIQHRACLGAAIYSTLSEVLFFVGGGLGEAEWARHLLIPFALSGELPLGLTLEFIPDFLNPGAPGGDNAMMINLPECFKLVSGLNVIEPQDMGPGYSMERLLRDIEMVLDYSDYCDRLDLEEKRESLLTHLGNIEQALKRNFDASRRNAYESALERLRCLEREMAKIRPLEVFENRWSWHSRGDAALRVWEFLSRALSPVRPPSPRSLSRRWKRMRRKDISPEEFARLLILRKHPSLARFFALKRSIRMVFKCLGNGTGREETDLAMRQVAPSIRQAFRAGPYRHLERFFIFT